jgi:hypothetical protein
MTTKLAALAAVAALAVSASGSASARTAEPSPTMTYMNGLDIHTASGRVVHVPLQGKGIGYTTLLGHGPQGWVVLAGNFHYYLVAHGHARRLALADDVDEYVRRLLSDDGGLIWESVIDQAGDLEVFPSDLTGHGAGQWELDSQ